MDRVSVTKTQASLNKILKSQEIDKNSILQAKLYFSGKAFVWSSKNN